MAAGDTEFMSGAIEFCPVHVGQGGRVGLELLAQREAGSDHVHARTAIQPARGGVVGDGGGQL